MQRHIPALRLPQLPASVSSRRLSLPPESSLSAPPSPTSTSPSSTSSSSPSAADNTRPWTEQVVTTASRSLRMHQHEEEQLVALGGWILHATRQLDGSLRLLVQHESCSVATVVSSSSSSSGARPNEVVFRATERSSWTPREENNTAVSTNSTTTAAAFAEQELEEEAEEEGEYVPEPLSSTGVNRAGVDADVARSVVSTLLSSLTTDVTDNTSRNRPGSFTLTTTIAKKRRHNARIEQEPVADKFNENEVDNETGPISKRRRRSRGDDVKRAAASPNASSSSSIIDPTFMSMPPEIQLQILQLVPMLELLRTVPLVSRRWNELGRDDGLWRILKHQYFGAAATSVGKCSVPHLQHSFRDQCVGFLRELKSLQHQHHRRLYEEERSYRQNQLIWGCSGGHTTFVSDLFRYHGALIDVDMLSASSHHAERTPLMVAVAAGNDDVASLLLLEKNADVNCATSDGSTPLMIAASKGHKNAVKFLLDQGAEVNRITKNGCSALMLAALAGHDSIATMLLERDANPCGKTIDGSTALMIAVSKGNKEIVHSLLEYMPENQRISVVNEARKDGWTALMIASTKGEEQLVRLLVQNGADVNRRKTGDGCTALMFAAAKGYADIVRFLLLHNADVNIRNRDGWSALMIAADWGHKECVEVFIENKDLFMENGDPFGRVNLRMALIVAFMKKFYDIFSILLQVGPPQQ